MHYSPLVVPILMALTEFAYADQSIADCFLEVRGKVEVNRTCTIDRRDEGRFIDFDIEGQHLSHLNIDGEGVSGWNGGSGYRVVVPLGALKWAGANCWKSRNARVCIDEKTIPIKHISRNDFARSLRDHFIRMTGPERELVQSRLSDNGYYGGPIDGLWGKFTEVAIIALFRNAHDNVPLAENDSDSLALALLEYVKTAKAQDFNGHSIEGNECDGCNNIADRSDNNITVTDESSSPGQKYLPQTTLRAVEAKCEGYSTLKGICWAQTERERQSVLEERGYDCAKIFSSILCRLRSAEIDMDDRKINFSCENFDICAYEQEEVAKLLAKEGIGESFRSSYRRLTDGTNSFDTVEYCGRGGRGSQVCVMKNPITGGIFLRLNRGSSGSEPSFD